MIQFLGSNIKCSQYLKSCTWNVLRHQSRKRELLYYHWPRFHDTILLVILRGKKTSSGFVISNLLINYLET